MAGHHDDVIADAWLQRQAPQTGDRVAGLHGTGAYFEARVARHQRLRRGPSVGVRAASVAWVRQRLFGLRGWIAPAAGPIWLPKHTDTYSTAGNIALLLGRLCLS
jgi:hypothetical protein